MFVLLPLQLTTSQVTSVLPSSSSGSKCSATSVLYLGQLGNALCCVSPTQLEVACVLTVGPRWLIFTSPCSCDGEITGSRMV